MLIVEFCFFHKPKIPNRAFRSACAGVMPWRKRKSFKLSQLIPVFYGHVRGD